MTPCTCCGCVWPDDGFYTHKGEIIMPCKVCRQDSASIYRLNNADRISAKKRQKYYADVDASRAYFRTRKREQRSQMSSIS